MQNVANFKKKEISGEKSTKINLKKYFQQIQCKNKKKFPDKSQLFG
jgi:hypothetical protein